jgi:hypothetical protein
VQIKLGTRLTPPDNISSREISTRLINSEVASDHSFDLVRTWLGRCVSSHGRCQRTKSSFMPTRVIEIVQRNIGWHLHLYHTSAVQVEP